MLSRPFWRIHRKSCYNCKKQRRKWMKRSWKFKESSNTDLICMNSLRLLKLKRKRKIKIKLITITPLLSSNFWEQKSRAKKQDRLVLKRQLIFTEIRLKKFKKTSFIFRKRSRRPFMSMTNNVSDLVFSSFKRISCIAWIKYKIDYDSATMFHKQSKLQSRSRCKKRRRQSFSPPMRIVNQRKKADSEQIMTERNKIV